MGGLKHLFVKEHLRVLFFYALLYPEPTENKKSLSNQEKLFIGFNYKPLPRVTWPTQHCKKKAHKCGLNYAVWTRLELATPCVTGRYSNQLNYQTVPLCYRLGGCLNSSIFYLLHFLCQELTTHRCSVAGANIEHLFNCTK